ncbi:hypothetical protein E2986_11136 [Frieseomelitta varia]|uniref:Uncharacterized protein n=1 Tax=Frieseomelitta varia TaxID=561572 RepID=A0A833VXL2_9HYME|nr:uncharacterized protein LOC122533197 [Frieseomelitta varia]KAF3424034.1 hypothetical protein E2986_11136 [Frieseomelitta varia]
MDFAVHEQNSCTSQSNIIRVENHGNYEVIDNNSDNWNKEISQNDIPTTSCATSQRHKKNSCNQKELQNKMLEEALLHRVAIRKAAELELKRKILELERLQWEFQRDKHQSDVRWGYDVRAMHYREEKIKRLKEH